MDNWSHFLKEFLVSKNVGNKAVDQLLPGPTPNISGELKEATKQAVGLWEGLLKKETDKTVNRFK